MSRRRHSDEIEFGSDSFLDIVANIVGILIILIVVAGIKAGTAPVTAERLAEYLRTHVQTPTPKVEAAAAPTPAEPPKETPHLEPLVIPPSPALIQQADALKAEIASLKSASETAAGEVEQAGRDEQADNQAIADLRQAIDTEAAELGTDKSKLANTESQLAAKKTGLLQLEVDVQRAEAVKPKVATLKHKLTPLGREINGKELHFRLLNNRVAFLPLEELIQRLRPMILRNRERLMRDGVKRGEIGRLPHGVRDRGTAAVRNGRIASGNVRLHQSQFVEARGRARPGNRERRRSRAEQRRLCPPAPRCRRRHDDHLLGLPR
jgi:hypothetical protein